MVNLRLSVALLVFAQLGCAGGEPPADDSYEEGDSFVSDVPGDSAFGGTGHPVGAVVNEAETACEHTTGARVQRGMSATARSASGLLCRTQFDNLGSGAFILNVRAAALDTRTDLGRELARVRVLAGEDVVAERVLTRAMLAGRRAFADETVAFQLATTTPTLIAEVEWLAPEGAAGLTLDYLELFRPRERMLLSPASGVLRSTDMLEMDLPRGSSLTDVTVRCAGHDITAAVQSAHRGGRVQIATTEYRTVARMPFAIVTATCPEYQTGLPVELVVSTASLAARVTYSRDPIACAFAGTGPRVLLTGFAPFPADATTNESWETVKAFDDSSLRDAGIDAAIMRVTLPVEYDGAAAMLHELVVRCEPDVVVGFGQGGGGATIERTAYNRKDTPGFPDNRGFVQTGERIVTEGPDERHTFLPAQAIADALAMHADVSFDNIALSDDPGLYICNNLFYEISGLAEERGLIGGFVHVYYLSAAQRQALVHDVIAESLSALAAGTAR